MNLLGMRLRGMRRYAGAVLLVAAAAGARAALLGALGSRAVFVTFFPAVAIAALIGGFSGGLLATILSAGIAALWLAPLGRLWIQDPADWLSMAVFLMGCLLISITCETMHRALARADTAEGQARLADERARTASGLRQSEERYRSLFENMLNGFAYCRMLFDQDCPRDFIYLDANGAFEKLTGLKNVVGKKVSEVIPGIRDADPELFEVYGRVAMTGIPERLEIYVKALKMWFEISVYSHEKEHFVAIFDVITERKRTEEALRESEHRFRGTFENAAVGFANVSLDNRFIRLNQRFCEIAGYPEEELLTKTWEEITHPQDLGADLDQSIKLRDGLIDSYQMETRYLRKDGSPIWINLTCSVQRDQLGRPEYYIAVIEDIMARKRAEEAQRESEERYRVLVENAAEAIVVLQDGVIRFVNPEVEVQSGYSREELTEKPFLEFVHPEDRARVAANHRRRLGGEPVIDGDEARIVRKDGTVGRIHIKGTLILWRGVPATLNLCTDITARKRAEEEREKLEAQLFQAQKMESVGRLAGGVAHDFNNMLNVITGYAELALKEVDPGGPLYRDLQEIQNAGQRSADLTRQLLAFARKQTVSPRVLDLNDTIEGMLKMLRRLIGEDINLTWNPGHALWNVRIDPSQIDQILANLVVNARDAISGVGQVAIETANVVFDEPYCAQHVGSVPGDYVLIALSDTGAGMSKEVLEHIFEPFFTTKEAGKGTGLGLATVYGIVKQNNGFIDVLSEPAKGTTFKLFLPRFLATAGQAAAAEAAKKVRGGTETILLVEDSLPLLELGRKILESLGYTVLSASTPQQTMELARMHAGDIGLLITDVVMPEMNGRQLFDRLCAVKSGIKCLYMSGYTADIIAHKGVLEEGTNFIQKPFFRDQFAAKIRAVLEET